MIDVLDLPSDTFGINETKLRPAISDTSKWRWDFGNFNILPPPKGRLLEEDLNSVNKTTNEKSYAKQKLIS